MKTLNTQYLKWFWVVAIGLFLFPASALAQGWEVVEKDSFEIPSEIIAPRDGGYLSIGTTIISGTGIVLQIDRVDLEGNRIYSKQYNVIESIAGSATGYTVNEFQSENNFLITGPKIGCLKILNNGNIDWQYDVTQLNLPIDEQVIWSSMVSDNHAFITTQGTNNSLTSTSLTKISNNGVPIWNKTFDIPFNISPISNITTNDNGCAILCDYDTGTQNGTAIIRTDGNGELVWVQQYPNLTAKKRTLMQDENGDLLFVENSTGDNILYRVNNVGFATAWKVVTQDIMSTAAKLMTDLEGNYVLTGHRNVNNVSMPTLMKFDENGDELWTRLHQVEAGATIISTSIDKENKVVSHGQYLLDQANIFATAYRIAVDSNGDIYENYISGNVYSDNNMNCANDAGDLPLSNWLIRAEGAIDFFGISDEQGNYSIPVPLGNYSVSISAPSIYYNPCTPSYNITATDNPTTFELDFGLQPETLCSYLQVEVSVPFLRFCYEQTYYVDYCNYGTEAATNVSVDVILDGALQYVDASVLPIIQSNNSFTFNIPETLEVGACGQFTITTQLTCDEAFVGSTACVEASISPLCNEPIDPSPHLIVNGFCEGDSIRFDIINIGDADLIADKGFIVIEDHVVLTIGEIMDDIPAGDFISRKFKANDGATMNFLIEQELVTLPTYFGDPYVSATVEGCIGFPDEPYTYGNFLDDDGEIWFSQECQEIISSFDPNDKKVIPGGVDEEHHYILPNTTMEYQVRFQNTGTDTAFLVVIRDTISQFLDLTTFVPGASSHPYEYEILHNGYLKFTFENIELPDSTTNEPLSNGFVKYTIRQKPDVPLGSVIENSAAIYFDFNSPVITNTTWNTVQIFDNWVVSTDDILEDDESKVRIYPNPFAEFVNFEIESDEAHLMYNEKLFTLYNSNGQLIHSEKFTQTTYRFHKNELPKGMYFYEIQQNGAAISSGKLILQ